MPQVDDSVMAAIISISGGVVIALFGNWFRLREKKGDQNAAAISFGADKSVNVLALQLEAWRDIVHALQQESKDCNERVAAQNQIIGTQARTIGDLQRAVAELQHRVEELSRTTMQKPA